MRFAGGLRARRVVSALVLAATVVVTSAVVATPAFASPAGDLAAATNSARVADGLAALSVQPDLTAVAQAWANQLAAANVLSHNANLRAQVSGWSVLGENVGMAMDIPSVQAAFMASTPHRDNILDPRYTQMGVGSASSTYPSCGCQVLWVVVDFRRPTSAGAVPPAAPATSTPAPKPAVAKIVKPVPVPRKVVTAPTTPNPPTPHVVAAGSLNTGASTSGAPSSGTATGGASASASATSLSTQLAATTSPSSGGSGGSDPVGRMVTFAAVVSQLSS